MKYFGTADVKLLNEDHGYDDALFAEGNTPKEVFNDLLHQINNGDVNKRTGDDGILMNVRIRESF